jgi:dienelactone hydrolase
MSRIVDWIETEPLLDSKRIASVGLSRNGKTSLVAGAMDERFAMVVSCCSGCCGAKLNHMRCWESETFKNLAHVVKWFAPNFLKYVGKDESPEMKFDQHQFLALVAPRLLYVSSATEDAWAGPRGEFAAAALASPAWELYGKAGLVHHGFPKADYPLHAGNIGYHLRTGLHDITRIDWHLYMDFADGHGWNLPR